MERFKSLLYDFEIAAIEKNRIDNQPTEDHINILTKYKKIKTKLILHVKNLTSKKNNKKV